MPDPSPVQIFLDPPTSDMSDRDKQLFADFGLEAHSIIYHEQMQERQRQENDAWDAVKPLKEAIPDDDINDDPDMGYLEPDDFGNEYCDEGRQK